MITKATRPKNRITETISLPQILKSWNKAQGRNFTAEEEQNVSKPLSKTQLQNYSLKENYPTVTGAPYENRNEVASAVISKGSLATTNSNPTPNFPSANSQQYTTRAAAVK